MRHLLAFITAAVGIAAGVLFLFSKGRVDGGIDGAALVVAAVAAFGAIVLIPRDGTPPVFVVVWGFVPWVLGLPKSLDGAVGFDNIARAIALALDVNAVHASAALLAVSAFGVACVARSMSRSTGNKNVVDAAAAAGPIGVACIALLWLRCDDVLLLSFGVPAIVAAVIGAGALADDDGERPAQVVMLSAALIFAAGLAGACAIDALRLAHGVWGERPSFLSPSWAPLLLVLASGAPLARFVAITVGRRRRTQRNPVPLTTPAMAMKARPLAGAGVNASGVLIACAILVVPIVHVELRARLEREAQRMSAAPWLAIASMNGGFVAVVSKSEAAVAGGAIDPDSVDVFLVENGALVDRHGNAVLDVRATTGRIAVDGRTSGSALDELLQTHDALVFIEAGPDKPPPSIEALQGGVEVVAMPLEVATPDMLRPGSSIWIDGAVRDAFIDDRSEKHTTFFRAHDATLATLLEAIEQTQNTGRSVRLLRDDPPPPLPLPPPLPASSVALGFNRTAGDDDVDPLIVVQVVNAAAPLLRDCIEREPAPHRGRHGATKDVLTLDVGLDGRVAHTAWQDGRVEDSGVGRCVAAVARTWQFGARKRPTSIEVPLILSYE